MKSLFRLPNLFLVAIAIFAFSACTEDPVFKIPPSVDFLVESGFLDSDATLTPGTPINVKITASKGDNPMTALDIQEDGVRISDISRITINGAAASSAAPILFDAEKDAFTWEISITPHETGAADYSFVVSDDGGESASTSLTITIEAAMDPPTLTAPGGVLALSATAGGLTSISLSTTSPSGADLATLSVYEGGALATGADRFFFGGITAADAFEGSFTLTGDDLDGFTEKDLFIRANATSGTVDNYTVEVTDANGLTATLDITVTATGTAITETLVGVLLNADGPQGQGGLDLDTGNGNINSGDAAAEIKDEGIDLAQPTSTNWKGQISPVNGTSLRLLETANFPEGFSFAGTQYQEEIQGAYDAGTDKTVSDVVLVGDIFVVYNPTASRYYLLEVTNVNLTSTDNDDSYTFDIKW